MAGADDEREVPALAASAVLVKSEALPEDAVLVRGHEFGKANGAVDYNGLLDAMSRTGFQATKFGAAVETVREMCDWKPSEAQIESGDVHRDTKCTVFLGYTSNLVSSGVRETIRFLVENKMVDVIVTTAGGVEEDLIKCLAPTAIGDFSLDGRKLRDRGLNRIGNLIVPNENYCKFEDWVTPILDEMLREQKDHGVKWTPSAVIARLGKEINDKDSICYWAWKNEIPIYSPALTDGSLGDMIFFHSYRNPGLVIDIVEDIRGINSRALKAAATGAIILGGGLIKHHICNANLMRNGADFAVYINTAHEFDGSDAGASPDEAISWGKIRGDAKSVKVCGDATLLFPLLVAQTFAQPQANTKEEPA